MANLLKTSVFIAALILILSPDYVESGIWTLCDTGDPIPPSRSSHSAIHDIVGERMIIFGGMSATYGEVLGDMWAMDNTTFVWSELVASNDGPPGLRAHAAIYDPITNSMMFFGGVYNSGGITNDFWILNLETLVWTQHIADSEPWPIPRFNCYGAYSQSTNEMIVFGGRNLEYRLNDLWALDLATYSWRQIPYGEPWPSVRAGVPMVMIDQDEFLIFGGNDGINPHFNDGWTFDLVLNQWTEYDPPDPLPTGRRRCSLAYEAISNRVLIYGGLPNNTDPAFSDLWQFDLNTMTYAELAQSGDIPAGRGYHSVIENFGGHKIIVFAGADFVMNQIYSDTYFLDWEYSDYLPGDVNMFNGAWPPAVIGGDVTYLVNYFRSLPASQPCLIGGFWNSADANGDCNIIGSDVTKLVAYFRGQGDVQYCPEYPPMWLSPDDLPLEAPEAWPGCE
ncbi:MAG: hypothetical protein GY839_17405 [candidate division Zixibacteria bacterium]|nr:hypothetical protein [candidate division Zixibacteria bacterium]